ncbi:MAG: DUF3299 domain-containing protein [Bacteroidetes bacterium]|nr:DUF3299 domain-containing protein [Bacteroidota bacterium]MDA1333992.1 DUF3299 domain-containing protein [Bacteroidota bacterium]
MSRFVTLLFFFLLTSTALAQETVKWDKLAEVDWEESIIDGITTYTPQFTEDISSLDGQTVTLSGFMIPLDFSEMQTNFLISAFPGDGCYFHMPGGPNSIAEVQAEEGVEFTYDTVQVEGKFVVLKDDPYGLLFRIVDAKPVKK